MLVNEASTFQNNLFHLNLVAGGIVPETGFSLHIHIIHHAAPKIAQSPGFTWLRYGPKLKLLFILGLIEKYIDEVG